MHPGASEAARAHLAAVAVELEDTAEALVAGPVAREARWAACPAEEGRWEGRWEATPAGELALESGEAARAQAQGGSQAVAGPAALKAEHWVEPKAARVPCMPRA